MKMTNFKKSLSLCLLLVLIAAMVLFAVGCSDNSNSAGASEAPESTEATVSAIVTGKGQRVFDFEVTDFDGKVTAFEIHTDKELVGDALEELGLLDGEDGPFGLYVKTVNGITADYDKDGKYWAFYVDGAYASQGVDSTKIEEGKAYAFKVE